jgi:hypothetical protein
LQKDFRRDQFGEKILMMNELTGDKSLLLSSPENGEISTSGSATTTATPDELTLLEMMQIFSTVCFLHPLELLQILEDCEDSPPACRMMLFTELMSVRDSPYGKRLSQIH